MTLRQSIIDEAAEVMADPKATRREKKLTSHVKLIGRELRHLQLQLNEDGVYDDGAAHPDGPVS